METIFVSDEVDRRRGMRVSRGGDRRERGPRVQRSRSAPPTRIVSPGAESSTAEGRLFDVLASVIAIAVLLGMLVLPVR
jgi:hypothetical protein